MPSGTFEESVPDHVPSAHGTTDGNRDRQADQPGGEVPQSGEVPQDEELADDDDQAGDHIPAPPGVGDPDDQNTCNRGQPIADPDVGADRDEPPPAP